MSIRDAAAKVLRARDLPNVGDNDPLPGASGGPDDELDAMRRCFEALEGMEPDAQWRVIAYLCNRLQLVKRP